MTDKEHLRPADEVLTEVRSGAAGLSAGEAAKRLVSCGANRLAEGKKKSLAARLVEQILNPMVLVLIAAAVVSAITAVMEREFPSDVIIILVVVVLNTILGVVQESKAEAAIEALRDLTPSMTRVIRDGATAHIRAEELVPGDVIVLEAGDAVPADARLLEAASLRVEEAALTGESVPAEKDAAVLSEPENGAAVPLGDRVNMIYLGTNVVYGRAKAVVVRTGMQTEMGRIAGELSRAEEGQTPLQQKLSRLSGLLTKLVLGICVAIFIISMVRCGDFSRTAILDTFMLSVSLAVAAIPEGLAAVVTIVLSMGVTKMSRSRAIIRRLTAVETLGCTQVICSDKTGTLTQNRMTVLEVSTPDCSSFQTRPDDDVEATREAGEEKRAESDESVLHVSEAFSLCTDAVPGPDGLAVGDPTQCAVVDNAAALGMPKGTLTLRRPRVGELPFDSGRKLMTTLHRGENGGVIQYTTGAPDVVISRCTHLLRGGKAVPMTDADRALAVAENKRMASQALRVLAAAERIHPAMPAEVTTETIENHLCYLGLVGMLDPVRDEVPPAIAECRRAGITPVMITGDHRDTAVAIARRLGIAQDASQSLTGAELDGISDGDLQRDIRKYRVYARVQPEHKVRIVRAWRSQGFVTAMTGDGVNDAPSIKAADIGVGMGITGTDVTKNVADMILADDNFATIVSAVAEGRRIYDNICKAIQFLLSSNLAEVLAIFVATLLGVTILSPVHILWINLITDSLPALSLGMEKGEAGLMNRPPRSPREGIFSGGTGGAIAYQGACTALLTLAAYFIGHFLESGVWEITESPDGMTMAFLTLSMAEIVHSYNMRSQHESVFRVRTFNPYLVGAMLLSLALTTAVIYVPFLRSLFEFEFIDAREYLIALALAACMLPLAELGKAVSRLIHRRKR